MSEQALRHEVVHEGPVAEPLFPSIFKVSGYGAAHNLHLLIEGRLKVANRWLANAGGVNRHGAPNYRVIWGWERPHLYGIGGGEDLEFFHLERWGPMEIFITENEWEGRESMWASESGGTYHAEPFPRHGNYFAVYKPCFWAVPGPDGKKVRRFRWPDDRVDGISWYEGAYLWDRARRARSRRKIAEQVAETAAFQEQIRRERCERIEDELGIRDLVEDQVQTLLRNPSMQKDSGLLLRTFVN